MEGEKHSPWRYVADRGGRSARLYFALQAVLPGDRPRGAARGPLRARSATGPTWSSALLAFLETGAFVGLVAPGRDGRDPRRRGRRPGRRLDRADDRDRLVLAPGRATRRASSSAGGSGASSSSSTGRGCGSRTERFEQVEGYFASHGGKTILVGRFIGLVRALAPFIAGSSGMQYRAFVPYSVLGTGLWAATFSLLGYASRRASTRRPDRRHRRADLRRAGRDRRRLDRDLALPARAREPREAARRGSSSTPGRCGGCCRRSASPGSRSRPGGPRARVHDADGGAVGRRCSCSIGYAMVVGGDPGPTPGDSEAIDIVDSLRTAWLTDVAKVVTALGSTPVHAAGRAGRGRRARLARRWPELVRSWSARW